MKQYQLVSEAGVAVLTLLTFRNAKTHQCQAAARGVHYSINPIDIFPPNTFVEGTTCSFPQCFMPCKLCSHHLEISS